MANAGSKLGFLESIRLCFYTLRKVPISAVLLLFNDMYYTVLTKAFKALAINDLPADMLCIWGRVKERKFAVFSTPLTL